MHSFFFSMFIVSAVWTLAATAQFHPNPFGSSTTQVTTHDVLVGRKGFEPSVLHASVGDTVNFHFYPKNHSIAESTFGQPCRPKTDITATAAAAASDTDHLPIFSGFFYTQRGAATEMFSMRVNKSDPIWLYSSQVQNSTCEAGQVMVINPADGSKETLEAYQKAAIAVNTTLSPTIFHGGVLVKDNTHLMNGSISLGNNETKTIDATIAGKKSSDAVAVGLQRWGDEIWLALLMLFTFWITL